MNPFLKRAAWVLVLLATLSVVLWTVANAVGTSRLNAAFEALEAAGYRTTAAWSPDPLPRSENGAPFYAASFALLEEESDEESDLLDNAEGDFGKLSAERRAILEGLLARNADALDMLAKAAARPGCRFERAYSEGFHMLLPELSSAMNMSRLLQFRADVRARAGDAAGARSDVAALLRLAEAFRDDAILVSQLVRMTLAGRALQTVERLVTSETPAADLRAWEETIRGASLPPGALAPAFRQELATVADFLRQLPADLSLYAGVTTKRELVPMFPLLRPLLKMDGAECLQAYRRLAEASALPHRQAHEKAAAIHQEMGQGSWSRPFRGLFLPALNRIFRRCIVADARAAVVRAGLQVERVRVSSGAYPDRIDVLDPATGLPLVYDRAAGRISSTASTPEEPLEWRLRSK